MGHDPKLLKEAIERALCGSGQHDKFFTETQMATLRDEFELPDEHIATTLAVLEHFAILWKDEVSCARISRPVVRKELKALLKATEHLSDLLEALSGDAWLFIDRGDFGRRYGESDGDADPFDLNPVEESLKNAKVAFGAALGVAGQGKRGRPTDDASYFLMFGIFQVWVSILRRDFRLDWTRDSQPITQAARFFAAVWKIIDPSISASRIANSARENREIRLSINSLEDTSEVLAHYSKQIR